MGSSAWCHGLAVGFLALAAACSGSEPPSSTPPAPGTTLLKSASGEVVPISEVVLGADGRTLELTSRPMQVGSCGRRRVPEIGIGGATVSGGEVIAVLQLPETGNETPTFDTCADLVLGSVSASVTVAEPFEGKTLVDRTSGLRLALPPTGFVRVGPLRMARSQASILEPSE
jgi:hypothetical protein